MDQEVCVEFVEGVGSVGVLESGGEEVGFFEGVGDWEIIVEEWGSGCSFLSGKFF